MQHIDIVREVEALEANIVKKKGTAYLHQAQDPMNSVLLLAKWAKSVEFLDASSCSNPSMVTIGSLIDQFSYNNGGIYANAIDIDDLPTSA